MTSGAYAAHLTELVESGEVPLDLVDDTVRRVLRMKVRMGLFESPYVASVERMDESVRTETPGPAARALALKAATASLVLLKNLQPGVRGVEEGEHVAKWAAVDGAHDGLGLDRADGDGGDVGHGGQRVGFGPGPVPRFGACRGDQHSVPLEVADPAGPSTRRGGPRRSCAPPS